MSEVKTADVIIVGSGIVGSSAAYYLRKRGCSCIVLDKDNIGNGASCRNAGGVRASGRDPREIPLAQYAIEKLWPGLSDELDTDIEFDQSGNLRFAEGEAEEEALRQLTESGRESGLDVSLLTNREARELCPYVSDTVSLAAWCPTDGRANPLKTTLGFYRKARSMGVRYYTGEKAVELRLRKGRVSQVVTERGTIYEGKHVILAAGYQSRELANTAGVDMPFRQKLIEVFVTEQTKKMFPFVMAAPRGFYGYQTKHGSFVFGGDSGLEHHPVFQERAYTISPTAPAISRGITNYFPELGELKIIRTWAGWIDLSMDLVPVIGPAREVPGLWLACGYSAHGFCLGPVTGKLMSQWISGEEGCVDCGRLSLDRF